MASRKSTEVAPVEPAGALAPLAATPALEIGNDDLTLPRLYMGQPGGDAVQEGRVPAHCLFTALGADDPQPNVIWTEGEGVLFHVLQLTQGRSASVDGDLRSYNRRNRDGDFVDSFGEIAPNDAYVTYNYVIYLPEAVDADGDPLTVPVKFLLKKSGAKVAKRINYELKKNAAHGRSAHALAFRLTTIPKKKDSQRWTEPQELKVDADPAHVAEADQLLAMLSDLDVAVTSDENEPQL